MKTIARSLLLIASAAMVVCACDKPASDAPKIGASPSPEKPAEAPVTKTEPVKAAGAKVASCNLIKVESLCREYGEDNVSAAGEEFLKGLCTGGEFKLEPCPKDKRVGSCVTVEGTKVYYSDGPAPLAADKAEKACKEGVPAGSWKAGQ